MLLEEKLTERTKLLSQLEQAKMQEQVSSSLQQMSELAAPKNVPTLDEVRDKIEKRYAVALGQADLAQGSMSGRILDVKRATLDLKGSARLDEIRASLDAEKQQSAIGAAARRHRRPRPRSRPRRLADQVSGLPQQQAAAGVHRLSWPGTAAGSSS